MTGFFGSIAVLCVVVILVGLVIYGIVRDKRRGKSSCSCGCGCSGCPMSDKCHPPLDKKEKQ